MDSQEKHAEVSMQDDMTVEESIISVTDEADDDESLTEINITDTNEN